MRTLGVAIAELIASPMHRAYRTAELMFENMAVTIDPIWHTNGGSYRGEALRARRAALAESVEPGNRLIISHIGTMGSVVPEVRSRVKMGDCVVVRPSDDGHEIVGFVPWRAWEEAAERSN